MAIRQSKADVLERPPNTQLSDEESVSSESEGRESVQLEEDLHTNSEDEDEDEDEDLHDVNDAKDIEDFHTASEDAEEGEEASQQEEALNEDYHTDPDDASASPQPEAYDAPLLPTELLKSRSTDPPPPNPLRWDQLTRQEKKALRDERGISMRELREETLQTGALQAGLAAQIKRGLAPADKVSGGRIAKKQRRKKQTHGGETNIVLSGKQKLLEQRERASKQSGKGSIRRGKRSKG